MDWIMYTVGIVAHLWALGTVLGILVLLNDPKVKYFNEQITIHGWFFVPWIMAIAFWMWFFFG